MKRLYPVEILFRTTQGSRKRVRLTGWMTGCVVIDWKRRFLFGCASVRRAWGVDEWGDKLRWMRNLWTEVPRYSIRGNRVFLWYVRDTRRESHENQADQFYTEGKSFCFFLEQISYIRVKIINSRCDIYYQFITDDKRATVKSETHQRFFFNLILTRRSIINTFSLLSGSFIDGKLITNIVSRIDYILYWL